MNTENLIIETDRLLIKPISLEFKEEIFNNFTPEITVYMYPKAPEKIEETISFIENSVKENNAGTEYQAVVVDKATNEFLGCAGLHRINTSTPEPGIWIKKDAHGNGYGKEVVFALKKWADSNLDYDYIIYPAAEENKASRRIPESLGGKVVKEYDKVNMSGNKLHMVEYWLYKER